MTHSTSLLAGLLLTASALLCTACDPTEKPTPEVETGEHVAYVLCEGLMGNNAATLSLIDIDNGKAQNDYFALKNQRGLGDQGQDILLYGSKMYITVTESKTLEIADVATGLSLKQIAMEGKPRSLVAKDGKVYICNFDRTLQRLDTLSLAIDGTCTLSGLQPEEVALSGNRLYVVNSWGKSDNGTIIYDSTLSVVDLTTFREIGKITVGTDPMRIRSLDNGRLVVLYGNGYYCPSGAVMVTPAEVPEQSTLVPLPVDITNVAVYQNDIYGYTSTYDNYGHQICTFYRIDHNTLEATRILEGYEERLRDANCMEIDAAGNIYIGAGQYNVNSDIHCFTREGTYRWSTEVGVLARRVAFL